MTDGRFSSLAAALKELGRSKELTRVDLTNVDVRDGGMSDLMLGVRKQRQLTEINLSNCGLGKSAAGHLATFLKYNKTVTRLYLQHNKRLEDEGLRELTKGLVSNSTLKVLNLANCNIGDEGMTVLAANCGAVTKLYLYNNRIREDGASAIANMIREKPSMIELFLWDNPLGTYGLDIVRTAHSQFRREADKKSLFGPRLNLVVGLGNEKVEKKAAPTVQRNFVLPSDLKKKANIDTSDPRAHFLVDEQTTVASQPDWIASSSSSRSTNVMGRPWTKQVNSKVQEHGKPKGNNRPRPHGTNVYSRSSIISQSTFSDYLYPTKTNFSTTISCDQPIPVVKSAPVKTLVDCQFSSTGSDLD